MSTLYFDSTDDVSLVTVLQRHVAQNPDHRLFTWLDNKCNEVDSCTTGQLWRASEAIAASLTQQGVKPGDRVLVSYPFGLSFLPALLACFRTGIIPCSVYPPDPRDLKNEIPKFEAFAKDAGAKVALTTTGFMWLMRANSLFLRSTIQWVATDRLQPPATTPPCCFRDIAPDDVAIIQYTSGSTGAPKGVMISHLSLLLNTRAVFEEQFLKAKAQHPRIRDMPVEKACFVSWLPQYHDMGLIGAFLTTLVGGYHLVACSPLDFIQRPLIWDEMIQKYKASATCGASFAYGLLIKRLQQRGSATDWSHVAIAIMGGEPAQADTIANLPEWIKMQPHQIWNGYGQAEVGVVITCGPCSIRDGLVSAGRTPVLRDSFGVPLSWQPKLRIVAMENDENEEDALARPVPDGTVGRLWTCTPLRANGYWGLPQKSKETFENVIEGEDGTWLETGDLGKLVDGELFVTGRHKDVIILYGKNYYPTDVERMFDVDFNETLRPGSTACFQRDAASVGIVAEARKTGGTKVTLWGQKANALSDLPSASSIRTAVQQSHGMKVSYICLLRPGAVPKTKSGKLRRRMITELSERDEWNPNAILLLWKATDKGDSQPTYGHEQELPSPDWHRSSAIQASIVESLGRASATGDNQVDGGIDELNRLMNSARTSSQRMSDVSVRSEDLQQDLFRSSQWASTHLKSMKTTKSLVQSRLGLSPARLLRLEEKAAPPLSQGCPKTNSATYTKQGVQHTVVFSHELVTSYMRNLKERSSKGEAKKCPFSRGTADENIWRGVPGMIISPEPTGQLVPAISVLGRKVQMNRKFYTDVPGMDAHHNVLEVPEPEHSMNRQVYKRVFSCKPGIEDRLRKSARDFIADARAAGTFATNTLASWTLLVIHQEAFDITLSTAELQDFENFTRKAYTFLNQDSSALKDAAYFSLLKQKRAYLQMYAEAAGCSLREAAPMLDAVITNSYLQDTPQVLNCALAVLHAENSPLVSGFELTEDSAKSFVWECLRCFGPINGFTVKESDGTLVLLNLATAGRDPKVWGETAMQFNPGGRSLSEYEKNSCFFVEPTSYRCPARNLVLAIVTAFLQEWADTKEEWRVSSAGIQSADYAPFYNFFKLVLRERVCILGGGAAGLTCALTLARAGVEVTVVECESQLGGHASHVVLDGHPRNPAFGSFAKESWPNAWRLFSQLEVEPIPDGTGYTKTARFATNGRTIPKVADEVLLRFLGEMYQIHKAQRVEDEMTTIGDYLANHSYGPDFIFHHFIGSVAHFFVGKPVQSYLDNPLRLVAHRYVALASESAWFHVDNAEYMQNFRNSLEAFGVKIHTSVSCSVTSRTRMGLTLSSRDGELNIDANHLVLATPPDVALQVLGAHASIEEMRVLGKFDTKIETVVLHQDEKWLPPKGRREVLNVRLPDSAELPDYSTTLSSTTCYQDSPIFNTYDYAGSEADPDDSRFSGKTLRASFSHVEVTPETMMLRNELKILQDKERVQFIGSWTQGLTLHEDAIVSALKAANRILPRSGAKPVDILPGDIPYEIPAKSPSALAEQPLNQKAIKMVVAHDTASATHRLLRCFEVVSEDDSCIVTPSDKFADLGLTSMETVQLRDEMVSEFGLGPDDLAINKMIEWSDAGLTIQQVAGNLAKMAPVVANHDLSMQPNIGKRYLGIDSATQLLCDAVLTAADVEEQVAPTTKFADLGLTSMETVQLRDEMVIAFSLGPDDLAINQMIEWSDTGLTIQQVAGNLAKMAPAVANHDLSMQPNTRKRYLDIDAATQLLCDAVLAAADVEEQVAPTTKFADLGLTSMETVQLRDEMVSAFGLATDNLTVTAMIEWSDDGLTIEQVAGKLAEMSPLLTEQSVVETVPVSVPFKESPGNLKDKTEGSTREAKQDVIEDEPWPLLLFLLRSLVRIILQLVVILLPIVYFTVSIALPIYLVHVYIGHFVSSLDKKSWKILYHILAAGPIVNLSWCITSGVLLIALKWILLGRQQPGAYVLWGFYFARRQIFVQCLRMMSRYSPWSRLGDTPLLSLLYRGLGCRIGPSSTIELNCIEDPDLVSIGRDSRIKGVIMTSSVSNGVLQLVLTSIGSRCSIEEEAYVEPGVNMPDNVFVHPGSSVPSTASLVPGAEVSGKPAVQLPDSNVDIESGGASFEESALGQSPPGPIKMLPFRCLQLFIAFFLYPWILYPLLYIFTIAVYNGIGNTHIFLLVLPWTLFAMVLANYLLACVAKWILLGQVKPGSWPIGGNLYCRKYLVDNMLSLLRGIEAITVLFGNPSTIRAVKVTVLRAFGTTIGQRSAAVENIVEAFDLLDMGDDVFFGLHCKIFPWIERNGQLQARTITLGDRANFGTSTMIYGGSDVANDGASAAYSFVDGAVGSDQLALGLRVTKQFGKTDDRNTSSRASDYRHEHIESWMATAIFYGLFQLVAQTVAFIVGVARNDDHQISLSRSFDTVAIAASFVALIIVILPPVFAGIAITLSHWILLPSQIDDNFLSPGTAKWYRHRICFRIFVQAKTIAIFLIRGTWEIAFYKALGLTVGKRAHIDNAEIFEPYLITIGSDCSLNGWCSLVPHDVQPFGTALRQLDIGSGFTMMRGCTLHGGDRVGHNVLLLPASCALIGTQITSGQWQGYPCEWLAPSTPPTKPLPPLWLRVMQSCTFWDIGPLIVLLPLLGMEWLTLALQHCLEIVLHLCNSKHAALWCGGKQPMQKHSRPNQSQTPTPEMCTGVYKNESVGIAFTLEEAIWQTPQVAKCRSGCIAELRPSTLIQWASCRLNFNKQYTLAEVANLRCFGIRIPRGILSVRLLHAGHDLQVETAWFGGEVTRSAYTKVEVEDMDMYPQGVPLTGVSYVLSKLISLVLCPATVLAAIGASMLRPGEKSNDSEANKAPDAPPEAAPEAAKTASAPLLGAIHSPRQVTAEWVGKLFESTGLVTSRKNVYSVSIEQVAVHGYQSETVRVIIKSSEGAGCPPSIIVKLPSRHAIQREAALADDAYAKEGRFYESLAPQLLREGVAIPKCIHCRRVSNSHLELVLEDLGAREGYICGDQVEGLTYDQMAACCVTLARLHAVFWDANGIPDWVPHTNAMPAFNAVANFDSYWEKWVNSDWPTKSNVSEESLAAARILAANLAQLQEMLLEPPQTLVHHDSRPDNFFVCETKSLSSEAFIFDWGCVGKGKGALDVAKLIICGFEPGIPSSVDKQRSLVSIYHTELVSHLTEEQARKYTFEVCWRDYRLGAAWCTTVALQVVRDGALRDANARSLQLFTLLQRYFGCLADLDIPSLFSVPGNDVDPKHLP